MEKPSVPSRIEVLNHALQTKPEYFDDLDASMLFLDADLFDFKKTIRDLGKKGKTFKLVFVINDLGETIGQQKIRLRQLKALLEDSRMRNVINKITVKGPVGTKDIEPNVFASDVHFEELG